MAIHINMQTFLETGQLGQIRLGMSRKEVLKILGRPPSWGVDGNYYNTTIWKYGSIELYFPKPHEADTGLYMIFSDHFPLVGTDDITIHPWVLEGKLTLADAENLLDEASIHFTKQDMSRLVDTMIEIQTSSQVTLTFHLFDDTSAHCLTALSLSR